MCARLAIVYALLPYFPTTTHVFFPSPCPLSLHQASPFGIKALPKLFSVYLSLHYLCWCHLIFIPSQSYPSIGRWRTAGKCCKSKCWASSRWSTRAKPTGRWSPSIFTTPWPRNSTVGSNFATTPWGYLFNGIYGCWQNNQTKKLRSCIFDQVKLKCKRVLRSIPYLPK